MIKKYSVIFFIIIFLFVSIFCSSYVVAKQNYDTDLISFDPSKITEVYNNTYIVPFGKEISYRVAKNVVVKSNDTQKLTVSDNYINTTGCGYATLSLTSNGKTDTLTFFIWNTYLKKGSYHLYRDVNQEDRVGTLRAKTYLAVSQFISEKSLKIVEHMFSTNGASTISIDGLYLASYYNIEKNASNSLYYAYSFKTRFKNTTSVTNSSDQDVDISGSDPEKSQYFLIDKLPDGTSFNCQIYLPEKLSLKMPVIINLGGSTGQSTLPKTVKEDKIPLDAVVIGPRDATTSTNSKVCENIMKLLDEMSNGNIKGPNGEQFGIDRNKVAVTTFSKGCSSILLAQASTAAYRKGYNPTRSVFTVEDIKSFKMVCLVDAVGPSLGAAKKAALQSIPYVDVICSKKDTEGGYNNYALNKRICNSIKEGSSNPSGVKFNRDDPNIGYNTTHGGMYDHAYRHIKDYGSGHLYLPKIVELLNS